MSSLQLEGLSKGTGAAKTGWLRMRVGGEGEELREATMEEGRNVGRRGEEEAVEVRHQPLMEAV
ncbi:hypothetical protein C7G92_19010, partial [Acinetobacter baumannii]